MEATTLRIDTDDSRRVLTPRGALSSDTVGELHTALYQRLLAYAAMLVDLGSLTVAAPLAVHVFGWALADAGGWPATRLVLFGADAPTQGLLRDQRVSVSVPVAADLDAARPLLGVRPARTTRRSALPCDPAATAHACVFVGAVCADWAVAGRFPDAPVVITELVANAVTHARTGSLLIVSLDQNGLRLAVRDWSTEGVEAIRMGGGRPGDGRGLHLVSELSRAWGLSTHPDGKTVWALLGGR